MGPGARLCRAARSMECSRSRVVPESPDAREPKPVRELNQQYRLSPATPLSKSTGYGQGRQPSSRIRWSGSLALAGGLVVDRDPQSALPQIGTRQQRQDAGSKPEQAARPARSDDTVQVG